VELKTSLERRVGGGVVERGERGGRILRGGAVEQWSNWSRTARAFPVRVERPRTEDEVQRIVVDALASGGRVRPVGTGFASNGIAVAPETLVDVRGLRGITGLDLERGTATFAAGTTLAEASVLLEEYGRVLAGTPSNPDATIGGAISTGAHGTGLASGSLSAQAVAVRIVTGEGELIRVSESQHPELWPAVRLGLGALGIVTEVTLRVVPRFGVRVNERTENLHAVLDSFESRAGEFDFFSFTWRPHTDRAIVREGVRHEGEIADDPVPTLRRSRLREFGESVLVALAKAIPQLTPTINRVANVANSAPVETTAGPLGTVFERSTIRYASMEYAFPLARVPRVVRVLDRVLNSTRSSVPFAVQVTTTAADDAFLSNAYGQDVGNVTLRMPAGIDPREVFGAAEASFIDLGGRPHWGTYHTLRKAEIDFVLPRFSDFLSAREDLDPHRTFQNAHLRRVLGE